jgi:predicted methyltransferase
MRTLSIRFAGLALALATFTVTAQIPAPVSLGPYTIPEGTPDYIRQAIESPERTAEEKARDSSRKPAEVLMMSGIKPGDHVIEIAGVGQYYTKILAAVVGPNGKVDVYDLPYTERFAGAPSRAFAASHPNTAYHQEDYNNSIFPQDVDVVFNMLYYHDLILQKIDTAKMNAKLLAALKPGGAYVAEEHKAEDGSGTRDVEKLHRIDVQIVKDELLAAGFELAMESDILAHPEDDRTWMVFTQGKRGATDRALFVFRKPK